ncbi:MAG TPA: MlaD family protein [Casimicrobiaceae bacterium]|jgi:ABC-type transporter Mla subunit MlaD|nr:MlaD family protein [Casimicrobiaceae bacterium]
MSQRANYFKLGLFVIGAIVAGVAVLLIIGTGRWFTPRTKMETYFNESVQGLDVGSKMKYRGVVIGEVTRISFTYTKYETEKPMGQRKRYVLVEAQLEPRLVGGKASTDIASPETTAIEVERGLRVRLAPQGITGTNYLEVDYVDPATPVLPIDWVPEYIYIPSAPSTVTAFVNAATDIVDRLRRLDIESTIGNLNKLLATTNDRIGALDTTRLQQRTEQTLSKIDSTLDQIQAKKLSDEAQGLIAELRQTNAELKSTLANPAFKQLPQDASNTLQAMRTLVSDPKLSQSVAHLERTLGRLDRMFGGREADLGTTLENLRQITDNLRDLTEDAKRYPSRVLFGAPPRPLEHTP